MSIGGSEAGGDAWSRIAGPGGRRCWQNNEATEIFLSSHRPRTVYHPHPPAYLAGHSMHFHHWLTIKAEAAQNLRKGLLRQRANYNNPNGSPKTPADVREDLKVDAPQYCRDRLAEWKWADLLTNATSGRCTSHELEHAHFFIDVLRCELRWWEEGRPWYGVYPVLYGLVENLSCNVPWRNVSSPFRTLTLHFPVGREPYGIACSQISPNATGGFFFYFQCAGDQTMGNRTLLNVEQSESTVADSLARLRVDIEQRQANSTNKIPDAEIWTSDRLEFFVKLMVFICCLSAGERASIIEDVVLARDQERFNNTVDDALKKRLVDAASRINGPGFHVGRRQQESADRSGLSPHVRRAHWHRYWTGPKDDQKLVPRWIDEIKVLIEEVAEVPTGMLGPESAEEMRALEQLNLRVPLSKRERYVILRRDEYHCQLCGKGAAHGVTLEIDHKTPVSKGGTNEPENLWTLCFDCNRGRSNLPLLESSAV